MIPAFVFQAFNELIAERGGSGSAQFSQEDVLALIVEKRTAGTTYAPTEETKAELRAEIFDRHWLDVESVYEAAGWTVVFDKPGYDETYAANFKFTPKRKTR